MPAEAALDLPLVNSAKIAADAAFSAVVAEFLPSQKKYGVFSFRRRAFSLASVSFDRYLPDFFLTINRPRRRFRKICPPSSEHLAARDIPPAPRSAM